MTNLKYDAKREYAALRNEQNKEINTLTEEQHEALAQLASARHELHSNQEKAFTNTEIWQSIDEAIEAINNSNLPRLYIDTESIITDIDYYEKLDLYDDLQEQGYYEEETLDDNCIYNQMKYRAIKQYEKINTQVESYLADIDRKHGTSYCPTGLSRE